MMSAGHSVAVFMIAEAGFPTTTNSSVGGSCAARCPNLARSLLPFCSAAQSVPPPELQFPAQRSGWRRPHTRRPVRLRESSPAQYPHRLHARRQDCHPQQGGFSGSSHDHPLEVMLEKARALSGAHGANPHPSAYACHYIGRRETGCCGRDLPVGYTCSADDCPAVHDRSGSGGSGRRDVRGCLPNACCTAPSVPQKTSSTPLPACHRGCGCSCPSPALQSPGWSRVCERRPLKASARLSHRLVAARGDSRLDLRIQKTRQRVCV